MRQIWLLKRCWFTSSSSWLGCLMSTVIRVTLTALLLRCPWQQRFFDIQTSANLRKFVLLFVSSISLKNRMPVIPFASERVFNSATFMPMLIPLKLVKTLRNVSNLHLKIYSWLKFALKMGQAQINVRTRACSRTCIARTKQAALTHNVRGKELNWKLRNFRSSCRITPSHIICLDLYF